MNKIDRLVICSAWHRPDSHWVFDVNKMQYTQKSGRRSAGYVKITNTTKSDIVDHDDVGEFVPIPAVNEIRLRVDKWRAAGYPGVTGVTRDLLNHWKNNNQRDEPLFFCQLEAIETIIWMTESDPSERQNLLLGGDGGSFTRYCSKMATGSGKTVVMAMLIVWQTLNNLHYPNDQRYSRHFLIVAPGLTVKERLGVLQHPDDVGGYYRRYRLLPDSMREQLKRATVSIHNWHTLVPFDDDAHSVHRRGLEDDDAFALRILDHGHHGIIVINDEAHHAWRRPLGMQTVDLEQVDKENEKMATLWVGGLDKIHRGRRIITCYDFTATPFIPTGKKITGETLFKWIISDFSLNDAIESGLVKTPCPPAGDAELPVDPDDRSKYYHLYGHKSVRADLTSRAPKDKPLPDMVRNAYMLLARDWEKSKFEFTDLVAPPVMLTICNQTRTAARLEHFFKNDPFNFGDLVDDDSMLRIDTNVLKAERGEKHDKNVDNLRARVSTVGKECMPGEQVKNIIAVSMLSEGWDANNVTQIMGLRAFTSQLLCEQVIGRGLRRQSYEPDEDGLLAEEYVSVMGVPFSLVPRTTVKRKKNIKPKRKVFADPHKHFHEITWPNVARIETLVRPILTIDMDEVSTLEISSKMVDMTVTVAPMLESMRPMVGRASEITLCGALDRLRMQTVIFYTVRDIYKDIAVPGWQYNTVDIFAQIERITEKFIHSNKIRVNDMPDNLEIRRSLVLMLNMKSIVDHISTAIRSNNTVFRRLILAKERSLSTGHLQPWYTRKDVVDALKSHLNCAPCDSSWEKRAARELDASSRVESWVKTDRLDFAIKYTYKGVTHEYHPDYLVYLRGKKSKKLIKLVLEIKGQKTNQSDSKHRALGEWVNAINEDGRFGHWKWDVVYDPDNIRAMLKIHSPS